MPARLRQNGARDMLAKELRVFKRLVKAGHNDEQIGCMLGRTTRGVRGLRDYYGLTDPDKYKRTGCRYAPEISEKVNDLLWDWVMKDKLTSQQMEARLRKAYPPGLHYATILTRLKTSDPSGYLWEKHQDNERDRRARQMRLRHKVAGYRTQGREETGRFTPREEAP